MRVTTSSIYEGIHRSTSRELAALQEIQAKSTIKLLSAADDPSGYRLMTNLERSMSAFDAYGSNMNVAQSYSGDIDTSLEDVQSEISRAERLITQATNDTWSEEGMKSMATEIDAILSNILGITNSRSGFDVNLFSGAKTDTESFQAVRDADGTLVDVVYAGDNENKQIMISDKQSVNVTLDGSEVFGADGDNLFNRLIAARDAIASGDFSAADGDAALTALTEAQDMIALNRSRNGIVSQKIESLTEFNSSMKSNYEELLSQTKDADYAKVATELMQHQSALQMSSQLGNVLSKLAFVDFN